MPNIEPDAFTYDETNPAKTIAEFASIDEREAEEILTHLSLTEYVALVTAIQNKDDMQITDIVDKNNEKQASVEEALDFNTKAELQKMAPKLPKGTSSNKPKSFGMENDDQPSTINTPNKPVTPTNPNTPSSLTNTTPTSSTGTKTTTGTITPTTTTSTTTDDASIVSADSKTGMVAIKDPKNQNKVTMTSIKDPNNSDEIKDLMKRSGITGII